MDKFFHSVCLDKNLCKGCINCIKHCPTQAIRVRNKKAEIINKFCIDCGECIRICTHHAKIPIYDQWKVLDKYEYTVALPAPSLYGQFNNLEDVDIVLTALLMLGFDDVFEVSGGAEIVSEQSRKYIQEHPDLCPVISTACPTVIRLIRVRFPNLIRNLLPIKPPVEVAAELAVKKAIKKTGLPREKIGIVFISPCPSKVTYAKSPFGLEKSEIDAVLAIKEIYPMLLRKMQSAAENPKALKISGKIGIGWGGTGGESGGLLTDNYLAADGITNVIRVLEDLEDEKFATSLQFIELNACSGGCVGGVLTVENPYIAQVKLKKLNKYMPVAVKRTAVGDPDIYWTEEVNFEPVYRLGNSMQESIAKLNEVEELFHRFPALDCGSCGAPTCRALAEDIVRGNASSNDCIHILKEDVHKLAEQISYLTKHNPNLDTSPSDDIHILEAYIKKLSEQMTDDNEE